MRLLKSVGVIAGIVVLIAGLGLGYLFVDFPKVGQPSDIKVISTPEGIERGRYLANHVTVCVDCHSLRDWRYLSGPIIPGSEGGGGEEFREPVGTLYSPNITPAAIGDWTDGEVIRAITEGVRKNGAPLFPLMHYPIYGRMATEDVHAIVAYIRTLAPLQNEPSRTQLSFPVNLIVQTIPRPAVSQPVPDRADSVAYGGYLASIAGCGFCHTRAVEGAPVEGMAYAGGFEFNMPWGVVRSLNITPDEETGIGAWTREDFVERFKTFEDEEMRTIPSDTDNTPMPWTMYAGMETRDLEAIYDYLRTVPAVKSSVVKYEPHE